ncbi:MAG: hypothetical protein ABI647_18445 [Gemmatimonadota bacterium]
MVSIRWNLRHSAGLLLAGVGLTGCRVATILPEGSRVDGGPVSSRGTISHEARSQVRIYRDAAGCESVQTVNRQFRVVTVVTDSGPRHRVLEEAYDIRHCLSKEATSSEAQVTVWRPDSTAVQPEFRIVGRGVEGVPIGNLYRMVAHSCCGSGDLGTYFSLVTGRTLFTSSVTPRSVSLSSSNRERYFAFHDTYSASNPIEARRDPTLVGVLHYGDDRVAAQRVLVLGAAPGPLAATSLRVMQNGQPVDDSVAVLAGSEFSGIGVRVELASPTSNRREWLEIPVEHDTLRVEQARTSPGLKLRRAP